MSTTTCQNSEQSSVSRQLGARFRGDILAAGIAAASISPIVVLIDSAIMIRAANGCTLRACFVSLLSTPARLFHSVAISLPARLVFAVYFGTYATANMIDTVTSFAESTSKPLAAAGAVKFGGTTAVATGLTIYKDARMARYFGTSNLARVPMMTYSLFAARDAITIYASFNLPAVAASKFGNTSMTTNSVFERLLADNSAKQRTAQFLLPAAAQFVTTPIHLMGLDYFNRQKRIHIVDRLARVGRDVTMAIPIRMVRIVPAFGLGGVINTSLRDRFMRTI